MSNEYDDLVAGAITSDKAQAARVGFVLSADTSPDAYAEAQRVARRTGVPVETALNMPKEIGKQARVAEMDFDALAKVAPATAGLLADVDKAKLAHDDVDNMAAIEHGFYKLGEYTVGTGKATVSAVPKFNEGAWGAAYAVTEGWARVADALAPDSDNQVRQLANYFASLGRQQKAAADKLMPRSDNILGASWYSGMQSLGLNALQLPLGAGGKIAPVLASMGTITGGQSYLEARDKGVPQGQALAFATSQGVIEAGTEMIGMPALFSILKPGQFLHKAAEYMVKEQGGEQLATALQDLNEWATLPENKDKTIGDYLADRPSAALQTALSTAFSGGGQVALMKGVELLARRNEQAVQAAPFADALASLNKLAEASKVRERDIETAQAFFQSITDEGTDSVWISPQALAQSGVANVVAQAVPAVAEQIDSAVVSGHDIRLPIADLLAQMPGPELDALIPHVASEPGGFTQTTAKEYLQSGAAQELQAEVEKAMQEQQADAAHRQEVEAIKADIKGQLDAAARFTPQVNDAYAALVGNFYAVQAARLGISPQEMYQRYRLRVQAEGQGGQQFDQGKVQTDTPEFRNWFGDSKVVDAEGKPLVVYHGTASDFTEFRPSRIGELGKGMYFTTSTEEAGGYTGTNERGSNAGKNVVPVYLRLRNPFVVKNSASELWDHVGVEDYDAAQAKLKAEGYDGIAFERPVQKWVDGQGVVNTGEMQTHYVVFDPAQIKSAIGNRGTFDPNDPNILHQADLDSLLQMLDADATKQSGIKPMSDEEVKRAEAEFLSHFPKGTRYTHDTRLLERVRRASEVAANDLRGNPAATRINAGTLGPFSGYETRAVVLDGDSFNPGGRLEIQVFGKEQVEQGLTDEPALTFTVSADGELSVNGPVPSGDTFAEFKARGWADRAVGAEGVQQAGWSALKDPANPGKPLPLTQIMPLLADVHARVREWRGEDRVGLHWTRATGALGGLFGDDATAVFFQKVSRDGTPPAQLAKEATSAKSLERIQKLTEEARVLRQARADAGASEEAWKKAHAALMPVAEELAKLTGHPLGLDDPSTATRFAGAKSGFAPDQQLINSAVKEFGVTQNPGQAGYILPDGRMLNFGEEGVRGEDHRAISRIGGLAEGYSDAMIDFMNRTGAVRVDFNSGLFEAQRIPTEAQMKAAIRAAKEAGIGLFAQASRPDGSQKADLDLERPAVHRLASFFEEQAAGKEFFQATGNRGSFNPSTNTITLLKNADLSTFLHESGHFFLEVMADMAAQPDAPAEVQKDMEALLRWFGIGQRVTTQGRVALSASDIKQGESLRDMAERFGMAPRELVESWKQKAPRSNTEQGALWASMDGIPELALYVAEHPGVTHVRENYDKFSDTTLVPPDRTEAQSALEVWFNLPFEEKRSYHEQFARGFEAYLYEGKAPSIEVQGLFQRFRAWLLQVYKSLQALNVELTDEVRGVMDRMLASSEQIRLAEQARNMLPIFETAEQAGMSVEEFAAYHALGSDASNEAVQELQTKGLRDMRWMHNARGRVIKKLQKEAKARRLEVQAEARSEVMAQPIYQAWQFLTGKITAEDRVAPEKRAASSPDVVDPTSDSLFEAIAKLGGIDHAQLVSEWGLDPAEKARAETGFGGKSVVNRKGGATIDEMGMRLAELGYLATDENGRYDQREFEEKFFDSLGGHDHHSLAFDYNALRKPGEQIANPKAMAAGRFDKQSVLDMGLPDHVVDRLSASKMLAKTGLHPDVVAAMFGFTSGDQLVRELATVEAPKFAIEGLTDQKMLEQYGELASPEAIEREADKAVHNDVRMRMVTTELAALERAIGPKRTLATAAKAFAEQMVARLKVRDLRPSQYANGEARSAKAAGEALKKGDVAMAASEKRNQLIQGYAAKATYNARDEVEAGVRYLKKFDGQVKNLDPEYLAQIAALLERFDLRKISNKEVARRASLAEWAESQREQGLEPDIPADLLNEALRTPYKSMTLEAFRGLVDTVKQIEHLGRLKHKLLTALDQRTYEEARDFIVASINEHAQGREADTRTPTTNLGRIAQGFRRFWAAHIKVASWARIMDGGRDGGPVWEYFIRSANERGDSETRMRSEATAKLSEILAPVFAQGKMGGAGQYFPSIKRSLNREARITIALNTGNEGNLQRLIGGEGWTVQQILPVLESLTKEEWAAVQAVWDHFESYRPLIGAKEMRVYGKEPQWVEHGSSITLQFGLRGGYYPIKYDSAASQRAEEHSDAEAAKRQLQGAYTSATTRRSFTKARVEEVNGRPLLYTLAGVYSGVNDVIHDLNWHEWLIDANRLMRSQSIDAAIRGHYGPEVKAQFKSWAADIAAGERGTDSAVEHAIGRMRQGVSAAGLGFNVMSAMIQPLGITQSMVRIGTGWAARGVAKYVANPVGLTREVTGKSSFMAERSRTRFRELNELRNQVQDQTAFKELVGRYAYWLMMRFQQMVDVPTWQGAYEKALASGVDETHAVALADQAVIDAQGSGMTKDLSAIERGGPLIKLFTTFYSFMNTALNVGVQQTMTANTPTKRGKLAADYLLLYVVPAVLGMALKNALTPGDSGDDEDLGKLAKRLAAVELDYLMGLMVIVREFSDVGKTLVGANDLGRDYTGPAGLRLVTDAGKAAKQTAQGEFDDGFRKALVNLVGDVAALPSAQINRTVTGAQALKEGKTVNPAALVFGFQEKH